jgi:hypothetical protein
LAADAQGNPIISGRYWNGEPHGDDVLAMKFDHADGHVLWMKTFDGPAHLDDRGWNLTIGTDDNPVITGMVQTSATEASFFTAKLDNADGSTIWQQLLPGAGSNPDGRTGWLASAEAGDVILVNETWVTNLSNEVLVHRFASADGASVWHRVLGSAGAISDEPRAALRLSSGDIAVAGTRAGDYLAMRIRASDGSVAWSSGYDGPPGWYDSAGSIVEGPSNEIIMGGFSSGTATGWDAVTVAFDPANGATLWDLRYDAGIGETDEVSALAVSPLGDLFVVGYAYTYTTYSDLLTLCYPLGIPSTGVDGAGPRAPALTAWPNPSRGAMEFRVSMSDPAAVRFAVFDAAGRERVRFSDTALPTGTMRLSWNGRDAAGRALPAGVYVARIEAAGISAVRKIVLAP